MSDTMKIAAKGMLILAAEAIGERSDRHLSPGEEAIVPLSYGQHLVADKFAIEAEPKIVTAADLKAARKAVQVAKAKLKAAGTDLVAKAAAEQEVAAAEAALEELLD